MLTGLTGSAISGETIFMESFAQAFVDMDINVQALHRIVTEAALVLNKLPNSSVASELFSSDSDHVYLRMQI